MLEPPLFAYGTLMLPKLLERIVGRCLHGRPARCFGYARHPVKNAAYPGMIAVSEAGSVVEGVLYAGLTDAQWLLLDVYETDLYSRRLINVQLLQGAALDAFAYVIPPTRAHVVERSRDWSFQRFSQRFAASDVEREPPPDSAQ